MDAATMNYDRVLLKIDLVGFVMSEEKGIKQSKIADLTLRK